MAEKEDSSFIAFFEERVSSALSFSDHSLIGAAVSGGADSVSLLVSLVHIFGSDKIRVITVNHNIRPDKETAGDADFVLSLCKKLSVTASLITIPRGDVDRAACLRGYGSEEAARFLRYKAFESFIQDNNLSILCLAHNRNDQLETLLMRFLQGSGSEGSGGIAFTREKYIRPLLDIPRCDIERYLSVQGFTWRFDATNADPSYLRNRIRTLLVPELNQLVPGWDHAVLTGAEKMRDDNAALETMTDLLEWTPCADPETVEVNSRKTAWCCKAVFFYLLPPAVQRRFLYRGCTLAGAAQRVPYHLIRDVIKWCPYSGVQQESAGGIKFIHRDGFLYLKKMEFMATECGFIGILNACGSEYRVAETGITAVVDAAGILSLQVNDRVVSVCRIEKFPVCIRSILPGDRIRTKSGTFRSVSGIITSWHVESRYRMFIPVVQDLYDPDQPLVAISGGLFGYPDWVLDKYRLPQEGLN